MNRLAATAARAHHRALEAASGVRARVRPHDTKQAIEVRLVPASSSTEEYDDEGAAVSARFEDWLVLESDWLERVGRRPEQRDEIDVLAELSSGEPGDVTRTFRVALASEPRPWRYTDHHRQQIRVHSVEIAPFRE